MNQLLTEGEKLSSTWVKLKAYMEKRIETLRIRNDGNFNDVETAKLRGQIHVLKELVALDSPAPPQASDEII